MSCFKTWRLSLTDNWSFQKEHERKELVLFVQMWCFLFSLFLPHILCLFQLQCFIGECTWEICQWRTVLPWDNLAWWGLDCGVFFFAFIFQWFFLHKSCANHLMRENCLHEKIFWKKDYCWFSGSLYMNMCLFCVAGWHGICPFHWKISACLFWIFWCEVWYHSQLNKPCKVDQGDFHSSPFCFGQPSFVQMRLTKLLSMLPNYSLHYTAASLFFCLVISGSVYNEQKPMWTCKQDINSLDAYTRTKLENNELVDKFKNLSVSNFLPLWNWETLYTQSLFTIWKGICKKMSNNYGLGLYQLAAVGTLHLHDCFHSLCYWSLHTIHHLAIGTPHFYDCFHWVLDTEIST